MVTMPVVLFFLAVGLVFVGNAFLLRAGGGFRHTNTGDEDDGYDDRLTEEKCNTRIPTGPGSTATKKSLASKYHTLLWPPTRRSLSISPSCGSLTKRLRARSGSFTGSITALGQQPQQHAVGNNQHFAMVSSPVPAWKLACLDWMKHDPNSTTKEVVSGWLRNGDEQTATK